MNTSSSQLALRTAIHVLADGRRWARLAVLLLVTGVSPSHASLILAGIGTGTGAGLGTSNVVLTLQDTTTETGCVGWTGTTNVIGSAACPGGLSPALTGGDERTGAAQTQTESVQAAGLQSGQSLVVILNVSEPAGTLFTVENLSLTVYSPTGAILYNSGNLFGAGFPPGGGVTLNSSFQTQGNLGFAFVLDAAQAAAVSPFICINALDLGCAGISNVLNANNRIGLAALITNSQGGNEVLSVASSSNVAITAIESTSVPEPASLALLALGLLGLAVARRRLR